MSRFLPGSTHKGEQRTRGRAFFNDRTLSTSSLDSIASTNTILPQYSETDEPPVSSEDLRSLRRPMSPTASELTLVNPAPALPLLQIPTSSRIVPPRYSLLSRRDSSTVDSPCLSSPLEQRRVFHHIEHSFPIRTNKPWATLLTFTPISVPGLFQNPRAKFKLPRFLENEPISGMVELELESSQTIQKISITLRGKVITGYLAEQDYTFLDCTKVLWHKSMGNPPSLTTSSDPKAKAKMSPGKLIGSYQIPFSFPFPNLVNLESKQAVLPESLSSVFSSPPNSPSSASSNMTWSSSSDRKSPVTSSSIYPVAFRSPNLNLEHDASVPFMSLPTSPSSASSNATWSSASERKSPITPSSRYPISPGSPSSEHDATALSHWHSESALSRSSTVGINEGGSENSISSTPQSFTEAGIDMSVQYELTVHVFHGFFRPDSRIKAAVSYLPSITPSYVSFKRRQAYENEALAPGPLSDPEGWLALPKSFINGQLGGRQVKIDCTLSYTRGTFIPCYLSLSGDDSDALNVLSTPNTPCLRLVRRLHHFCRDDGSEVSERIRRHSNALDSRWNGYGSGLLPSAGGSIKGGTRKTVVSEVGAAVWWVPPKDTLQDPYNRHLEGEIQLAPDLQPSCTCPIFQVEYFVEMHPFSCPGFQPLSTNDAMGQSEVQSEVLTSQPVEIATFYSPEGPPPVSFTNGPKRAKNRASGIRESPGPTI